MPYSPVRLKMVKLLYILTFLDHVCKFHQFSIIFFFLTTSEVKLKVRLSLLINLYNSSQISSAKGGVFYVFFFSLLDFLGISE